MTYIEQNATASVEVRANLPGGMETTVVVDIKDCVILTAKAASALSMTTSELLGDTPLASRLEENGLHAVAQIVAAGREGLYGIPYVGRKAYNTIADALIVHDLRPGMLPSPRRNGPVIPVAEVWNTGSADNVGDLL